MHPLVEICIHSYLFTCIFVCLMCVLQDINKLANLILKRFALSFPLYELCTCSSSFLEFAFINTIDFLHYYLYAQEFGTENE